MLNKGFILPFFRVALATTALLILQSCASLDQIEGTYDPFEPVNRKVYVFNDFIDKNIAKPVAQTYETYIPNPVQLGVHSFFGNIDDFSIALNDFLQLKGEQGISDSVRFTINSTIGLLGIFDLATDMGFAKHNEDLNQTLGYWGVPDGPFIMLPLLGAYNLRSATSAYAYAYAQAQSKVFTPIASIKNSQIRNSLMVLDFFDTRVHLLLASDILDIAALDSYSYMRESYTQRQRSLIDDGNPSEDEFDELDELD
jgi:phospholipid-binding lipoprotein MlaA